MSNIYEYEKLKHTTIPKEFTLIIDTREQRPLFQDPPEGLKIIYKALKHGDYSILDYEHRVTIERKMMSDFISYIGSEREKHTIPKLEAMKDFYFKALVVECDDLLKPSYFAHKVTPSHVKGFLMKIRVQFGVHVYNSADRRLLELFIIDHLVYAFKKLEEIDANITKDRA